jgi:hypothetical protein
MYKGVLCYLEPSIVFKAKVARHVRMFDLPIIIFLSNYGIMNLNPASLLVLRCCIFYSSRSSSEHYIFELVSRGGEGSYFDPWDSAEGGAFLFLASTEMLLKISFKCRHF